MNNGGSYTGVPKQNDILLGESDQYCKILYLNYAKYNHTM